MIPPLAVALSVAMDSTALDLDSFLNPPCGRIFSSRRQAALAASAAKSNGRRILKIRNVPE